MADYLADVQKYDSGADGAVVDKIVKRLGIALRSRDARTVSCTSESELKTVKENWCKKRLELDEDRAEETVQKVCADMKGVNAKSRVTFYYLCARHSGTMDKVRDM